MPIYEGFDYMKKQSVNIENLAGKILIAHPIIEDKRFKKSVVFLESCSEKESIGIILNRPLGFMLKAMGKNFADLPIGHSPVYYGGPDGSNTVMQTAWVLNKSEGTFEIYYTLSVEEATRLMREKTCIQLRSYLGYCKFGPKLFKDIQNGVWVVGHVRSLLGAQEHEEELWSCLLRKEHPNALLYRN